VIQKRISSKLRRKFCLR